MYFFPGVILVLAVAILMFGGCGEGEEASGTFTYADLADPVAIDPAYVEEEIGANINRYLFEGLVKYDSVTGQVVPGVAEEWEVSEDATEFTFKLRKGVRFSNGRELVADDFVYSWTRALDPATESPMALVILEPVRDAVAFSMGETDKFTGVEAVDDHTLKVTLEYPLAEFVTFLGHPVCAPVPKEEVEAASDGYSEKPVGNGPFMLREWKHDQELVLERNPEYDGEAARVEEVIVKIIPDEATAIEELKAGNVDAVKSLPPGMDESLRADAEVTVVDSDTAALWFAAFNMAESPWSDSKALREAVNFAVDRETLADVVMQGHATAADAIVPSAMAGHQDDVLAYRYDPEQAKAKLAEAGYPEGNGLPAITLTYPSEGTGPELAQAVQSQLKEVGIQVEINGLAPGDFIEQMTGQQLSFFIISWGADYPSVDTFLYTLFHSSLIGPGAPNISQYANDEVDLALDDARASLDAQERSRLYQEAEGQILADAPIIPLVFSRNVMAYSSRVSEFVVTPMGDIALDEVAVSES
ncbi:MAG: ABC transporter substrate-binding protein [Gaiellales bacterium]|nr:MAG: ABC transporter substrate-binding protein [Gaiellales bacterium]